MKRKTWIIKIFDTFHSLRLLHVILYFWKRGTLITILLFKNTNIHIFPLIQIGSIVNPQIRRFYYYTRFFVPN